MTQPTIAQLAPYFVDVIEGKSYWWCQCGKSKNQPFCDGSHEGSEFSPIEYIAQKTGTAFFCGCKRSKKGPICDGTHNRLED